MQRLRLVTIALALSAALPALAQERSVRLSLAATGVKNAALAGGATTRSIDMEDAGKITNQLSLTLTVTPGTTTRVRVTCHESDDNGNWAQISLCDSETPATCTPDGREYTLSEYTTVGLVKLIPSRWSITKRWSQCTVVDPDGGTGTVSVTGARSWQTVNDRLATQPRGGVYATGAAVEVACTALASAVSAELAANSRWQMTCDSDAWGRWCDSAACTAAAGDMKYRMEYVYEPRTTNDRKWFACLNLAIAGSCWLIRYE